MWATGVVLLLGLSAAAQEDFRPLFDGRTLAGWTRCNGQARYDVEDGAILGTTAEGSPNSFLCTEIEYGDFVLEFEVKTDPALNSGVQIRSHRYAAETRVMTNNGRQLVERKHPAGRVHGYQVEISNEKAGTSGGIYDEARRGWLHNTSSDAAARRAFRDNQWNHYRVEAVGDRIRTWVNGVACADLVDPMDQSGFIALQVHAYKGEKPAQVRWRNLRIRDLGRHGWKPLWDGRSWNGWTREGQGEWSIEDGAIHARSLGDSRGGFLISERSFADATARLRFKLVRGNSGFFLRMDPKTRLSYEAEIDEAKGTGGLFEPGGRRWIAGPEDNAAVRAGEWNELAASIHGGRVVFHLNGIKTVELVDDAGGRKQGRLALQVHSRRPTEIWFKDIEILSKLQ